MRPFQCLIIVALFYCPLSAAIILTPTVMPLNIDKGGFAQFVITNNATATLPLEVSVHQLLFEPDGSYQSATEPAATLMVFPPAAMIHAGQKQAFRVQWSGVSDLPASQSFFVRFAHIQLTPATMPAGLRPSDTGVNIQINYNALLHVYSDRQRADIVLRVDDEGSARLTNLGDRFTYTNRLNFEAIDSEIQSQFETVVGDQFIAPYTTLVVDAGLTLPAGEYHGREIGF
ncbi:hypothetical protein IT774_16635 [Salinimonas marina]|uniref:Molecular chaperone n=1 Tax=Salinimonas marina TaxID=2785918 RepID=A0A7S9HDL0_9ALTE|nr:hypothetical protein [Salinimonas marina]QPG05671.1 hypothetical protein IT774_16635 [Salinimonas marina]